jgi:hypothetical protein
MRKLSAEQRSVELYLRRWRSKKKLTIPSWWSQIAPRQTASFWREAEARRKEAGVHRGDVSGMTYIINVLRSEHERHRRDHRCVS